MLTQYQVSQLTHTPKKACVRLTIHKDQKLHTFTNWQSYQGRAYNNKWSVKWIKNRKGEPVAVEMTRL